MKSERSVGRALTIRPAVIDAALRTAGRSLSHPVSSAEFNLALRESGHPESFRSAVNQLAAKSRLSQGTPISKALIQAWDAGEAAAGPLHRGARWQEWQRLELAPLAFALNGLTTVLHLEAAAAEWWRAWPPGCDYLPDDEEQALFERWKGERLRRRTWPSLPTEERVLLLRPVFELVYLHGAYRALARRS